MTSKIDTSQQSASSHGCCGSQASKEKAVAVAKPEAASSSAAKRSAPAKAVGSCCHGEGPSDADQVNQHGHQS